MAAVVLRADREGLDEQRAEIFGCAPHHLKEPRDQRRTILWKRVEVRRWARWLRGRLRRLREGRNDRSWSRRWRCSRNSPFP
jgi:hypothetical protein